MPGPPPRRPTTVYCLPFDNRPLSTLHALVGIVPVSYSLSGNRDLVSGVCHVSEPDAKSHLLCLTVGLFWPLVPSSSSFFVCRSGCLCREPSASPSGVRKLAGLSLTKCSTSPPSEVDVKTWAPSAHGESSLRPYNTHIAMINAFQRFITWNSSSEGPLSEQKHVVSFCTHSKTQYTLLLFWKASKLDFCLSFIHLSLRKCTRVNTLEWLIHDYS